MFVCVSHGKQDRMFEMVNGTGDWNTRKTEATREPRHIRRKGVDRNCGKKKHTLLVSLLVSLYICYIRAWTGLDD